jgi:hypothetical protein
MGHLPSQLIMEAQGKEELYPPQSSFFMLNVMGTHFIKHAKLSQVTSIIAEEVDKGFGEQPEDMEKVRLN